jgi:SAM-dependent methyltransferase
MGAACHDDGDLSVGSALAGRPAMKRLLPAAVYSRLREMAGRLHPGRLFAASDSTYETLYDRHARAHSDEDVVGAGAFDLIGRLELSVLVMEGLRPTDTVVDFGCGTGRLAVHVIPRLVGGHYVGIDVSRPILEAARARVKARVPAPPCRVTWLHQTTPRFALAGGAVDVLCAFSVFTHMEHEDAYRYLADSRRIVRPGGRVIFSCLPLDLQVAREIFLASAAVDLGQRWSVVRNVTTSRDLMEAVSRLAGWTPVRWYAGDGPSVVSVDTGEASPFGQSICVLEPAGREPAAAG